ncbi:YoaK family protein [Sphingomonas sp. TX0543]|uniref:YoaK family protein n=1 Tax=unclassified Sphingomonas TaxID=196159 RepID=UPI0010F4E5E7|nr:YoaK family protein [Sphingomonas sp. 3P27F8]
MIRYDVRHRMLAMGFAAQAGFVDAVGFMKSGGLFVSFMSGNSTRLAVGLSQGDRVGLIAAGLIALFVSGVAIGVLFAGIAGSDRKSSAAAFVALLILLGAVSGSSGLPSVAIGLLCLAMGASNAVFQRDGDVGVGVTYMTGTLVKLGYRLADAVRGRPSMQWVPYLALWLALVVGGVAGALCESRVPAGSLWIAAASSAGLALACRFVRP